MSGAAKQSRVAAAATAAGLGLPAAQALYALVVRLLLRRTLAQLRRGDVEAVLRLYDEGVRFVFPGNNSWAADFQGKDRLRPWLRRFVRVGLELDVHDILVSGPPWRTTVCVRFTDRASGPDGRLVYENRGVIVLKLRWGKVIYEEANEDTERIAAFDRHLEDLPVPPRQAAEQTSP
jgi:ketosteroid isomerase-like protein